MTVLDMNTHPYTHTLSRTHSLPLSFSLSLSLSVSLSLSLPLSHTQEQLRRQQQLLQGLQSSSGTAGSSVYISPASAFSLEISGLGIAAGGTDSGGAVGNFGGNPQVKFDFQKNHVSLKF